MKLDALNRLLTPLYTRVSNMVGRAVVKLVKDSGKLQTVQIEVLDGEIRDGCERFQQFGFTSVPLAGAEAVALFVGGRRDHPLVIAVDDRRYRLMNLGPGESAVYNDLGEFIHVKHGRAIVSSPEVRLGSDSASNFVALANLVLSELNSIRSAFNTHVHVETGASTAAPTVQLGSAGSVAATKVKAQ